MSPPGQGTSLQCAAGDMKKWSQLEGTIHREVGTDSGSYSVNTKIAEAPGKTTFTIISNNSS